jgi:hypothetical protein
MEHLLCSPLHPPGASAADHASSIESLVEKVWVNETIPHHEGMHIVTLVEHAVAPAGAKEAHFKIEIIAQVKHYAYLGSLPIKMIGVRDEQEKWISTKHITTHRDGWSCYHQRHRSRMDRAANG